MKYKIVFTLLLVVSVADAQHISDFTSLSPGNQDTDFHLPSTHTFQYLIETGDPLTAGGTLPDRCDFAGYVPINGSSTNGYLSINSEDVPGAITVLNINLNSSLQEWQVSASEGINIETQNNCSGEVTSWGTALSCEESLPLGSGPNGYKKFGWVVEVDPATKTAVKMYAMGNIKHENVKVHGNNRTAYMGEDHPTGNLYKFVANNPSDLSSGLLYVLKLTGANGSWILLNNSTALECNTTKAQAAAAGATNFAGIEDVDISPINGKVYFAVKNESKVYRFDDSDPISGLTVSNFETFVGGMSYSGEAWGVGNDNLAFDNLGNLWVCQDGGKNYVWIVGVNHTQLNPDVKIFTRTPAGCEPTGMTFSPDFKYMFISIMHPNATNSSSTVPDAFGNPRAFDEDVVLVIARTENLGNPSLPLVEAGFNLSVESDSVSISWNKQSGIETEIYHRTDLRGWNRISITHKSEFRHKPSPGTNYYKLIMGDFYTRIKQINYRPNFSVYAIENGLFITGINHETKVSVYEITGLFIGDYLVYQDGIICWGLDGVYLVMIGGEVFKVKI